VRQIWVTSALIIAFAFPVLEMLGIYRIWQVIGAWTLVWLGLAVLAGLALIAAERASFLPRLLDALRRGAHPVRLLFASGQRFLAGLCLIVPGALSDIAAVLLLLGAAILHLRMPPPPPPPRPDEPGVIEGEFRRVD